MLVSQRNTNGVPYTEVSPFSTKALDVGKLYRRVYGQNKTLIAMGDTTFDFIVPYDKVKINKIDLNWFPEGCICNLKIYDNANSDMQTLVGVPIEYRVPNKMLDQFGFAATITADRHNEYSEYDADLLKDMKVEIVITNLTNTTKLVGINVIYHEVKI